MKNFKTVVSLIVFSFLTHAGICQSESLYPLFSKKQPVKVYVAAPTDVSEQKAVEGSRLKKELEDTLAARKSIRFQAVPTPDEADLTIDSEIVEYYWTDHDPVDMIMGVGATALDAARVENYARLQAILKVADVKTRRMIWQDKLMATLTGGSLTKEDGPARIANEMAQVFVRNCFGKKRSRS